MTRSAIIRGLASWAKDTMTKEFAEGGPMRVLFSAAVNLADANPELAAKMLLAKFPALLPLIDTVRDADSFSAVWSALTASVEENGTFPLEYREPLPPFRLHIFRLNRADLDAIRARMETAYRQEAAAAKSVIDAANPAKE